MQTKLRAGHLPTPAQTVRFLKAMVADLAPFKKAAPQTMAAIKAELEKLGWDVYNNQLYSTSTAPSATDILAFLRRASAAAGGGRSASSPSTVTVAEPYASASTQPVSLDSDTIPLIAIAGPTAATRPTKPSTTTPFPTNAPTHF